MPLLLNYFRVFRVTSVLMNELKYLFFVHWLRKYRYFLSYPLLAVQSKDGTTDCGVNSINCRNVLLIF